MDSWMVSAGSVLKQKLKPQFWEKTELKLQPRFWRGPSQFWGHTRLTDDVMHSHSLNDVVLKMFLILPLVQVG